MNEDIRNILKSDDRLNNEAIEKFVSIQKEIVNIYCGNCLLASYNNLKVVITKNKKLENYYCSKCNLNEYIYMEVFSYPDGDETACWVLHGDGAEVDSLKIDEMYELGLRSMNQKWLKYKNKRQI